MATSTHGRRRGYSLAIAAAVILAATGGGVMLASGSATADVDMGALSIADHNQTVGGDVSDVTLSATLDYAHDVPDADRRIIRLKAGPTEEELSTLAYQQERDPTGTASGSVDLSGSLVDGGAFDADAFDPALAATSETDVVVQAVIEVQREGGDPVTHTLTDTATVTLNDDATLTVDLGGTGTFHVETA